MSQIVFAKVIRRLTNIYGVPNVPDEDGYFDEFCRALDGYAEMILEEAVSRVVKEHTFPTWPTVGEVVKQARTVAYERQPRPKNEPPVILEKKHVGRDRVNALVANMRQGLNGDNDFEAIVARCPRGGSVNVSAPWGEEVRDRDGNIIPIRKKKKGWAA